MDLFCSNPTQQNRSTALYLNIGSFSILQKWPRRISYNKPFYSLLPLPKHPDHICPVCDKWHKDCSKPLKGNKILENELTFEKFNAIFKLICFRLSFDSLCDECLVFCAEFNQTNAFINAKWAQERSTYD